MVLLTIAISGGPFLGLLGTVVGVMITFAAIAASGDVNVNAIAPGIAAALVATVAGLGVAIPALFGYNYLNTRIKEINADMRVFVDEFVTRIAEHYSLSASAGRERRLRRHQRHADARSRVRAARHLHHHDDGDGAGHQGQPAEGERDAGLAKPKTKAITITADGTIYLDTYPVTLPELEQLLRSTRRPIRSCR